jgi:hypothetical protein
MAEGRETSLFGKIARGLAESFPEHCQLDVLLSSPEKNLYADAVVEEADRFAMVEVKVGDPDLPLPFSTPSQVRTQVAEARKRLGPDVIPVLVTNYEIPEVLKSEMESDGVKILSLPDSRDALADLGKQFAKLVGFHLPAK